MGTETCVRNSPQVEVRTGTYVRCPREALGWHSGGTRKAVGRHSGGARAALGWTQVDARYVRRCSAGQRLALGRPSGGTRGALAWLKRYSHRFCQLRTYVIVKVRHFKFVEPSFWKHDAWVRTYVRGTRCGAPGPPVRKQGTPGLRRVIAALHGLMILFSIFSPHSPDRMA